MKLVYKNVVGTAPSAADLSYFVELLDVGSYTQSSLAQLACETDLNKTHIDLVGLMSVGMEFIPVG